MKDEMRECISLFVCFFAFDCVTAWWGLSFFAPPRAQTDGYQTIIQMSAAGSRKTNSAEKKGGEKKRRRVTVRPLFFCPCSLLLSVFWEAGQRGAPWGSKTCGGLFIPWLARSVWGRQTTALSEGNLKLLMSDESFCHKSAHIVLIRRRGHRLLVYWTLTDVTHSCEHQVNVITTSLKPQRFSLALLTAGVSVNTEVRCIWSLQTENCKSRGGVRLGN